MPREPAKWAAASTIPVKSCASVTIRSSSSGRSRIRISVSPSAGLLDLEAVVASAGAGDRSAPTRRVAHGEHPAAPRTGARERALDRDPVRPLADRRHDQHVAPRAEMDARDAPGKLKIRLDAFERRLSRGGDEDRVGISVAGARLGGQRVAGTRHGLSREGEVDVVERPAVKLRDPVQRTRRGGHQLGADAVAGQTGNGLARHPRPPSSVDLLSSCSMLRTLRSSLGRATRGAPLPSVGRRVRRPRAA